MAVVGFIRGRCFHLGAPWVLLRSLGVVGFIRVRTGGRWIHLGALVSFGCALVVVGFIGGDLVHSGASWSLCIFTRGRWVRPCVPMASLGSFWVVWFVGVRPGGRWVHSGSLSSFMCALVVVGLILGSLGSFGCALCVVWFIRDRWVHSCAFWVSGSCGVVGRCALVVASSFRVVWFIRVRPGDRRVHSASFSTFWFALVVI